MVEFGDHGYTAARYATAIMAKYLNVRPPEINPEIRASSNPAGVGVLGTSTEVRPAQAVSSRLREWLRRS